MALKLTSNKDETLFKTFVSKVCQNFDFLTEKKQI